MLARYTILRELGRGAIGAVYAARDSESGTVVALKTLDPDLLGKSGPELAARFLRHARSAQHLSHPNIVQVLDAGEIAGTVYVAMEMLEGDSLRRFLDAGPLGIARGFRIAQSIASGLAHAHLEGVVHGGLKPSKVIVLRSGEVKITDFGIAQLGQSRSGLSPEQARGDPVDHRCDIFSFGALLYEMLVHRPPDAQPRAPSELNPHLPRAVDGVLLGMLARQPGDRPAGFPVVLRELKRVEEALGPEPTPSARTAPPSPRAAPPSPRVKKPAPSAPAEGEAFDYQAAMAMMERESRQRRRSGSRPSLFSVFAFVLGVAGLGFGGFMYYSSEREAALPPPMAAQAPVPPPVAKATPVAEKVREPAAPAPPPVRLAVPEPAPVAKIEQPPQPIKTVAKAPEPQPVARARLVLEISPRGEIWIDGEHHGTTPPITTLDLEPGMHRIEVRSGSRTPYLTYMTVQAGEERRIRYDFSAKGRPPPGSTPRLWADRR